MRTSRSHAPRLLTLAAMLATSAALLASPGVAHAQSFQLNRYEPTAAGEWFFAVERPWYSSTRWFAGGVTLDYGHNPLVLYRNDGGNLVKVSSVVEHQLLGHLDLAGSFLDRVLLSATLPITLFEAGTAVGADAPLAGAAVGDPRVGVMVRLWHHAEKDAVSIHFGGDLWIPIGAEKNHAGDPDARGMPKLVLGGLVGRQHLKWSFQAGYLIRARADLAAAMNVGNSLNAVGQELRLGLALAYTDVAQTFQVGPEILLATVPTDGHAFAGSFTSLELLVGGGYHVKKVVLIGAALGFGILREPGTPDFRFLLRVAYAPMRDGDRDKDGIADARDACPDDKGVPTGDPKTTGCPDRDGDLVIDKLDACPDVPKGAHPDPERLGCPLAENDKDKDGVLDPADQCVEVPAGKFPDAARPGCPADRDGDGVLDEKDECIDVPAGARPDAARPGCPLDTDKDGVLDDADQCVEVPAGKYPDAARSGCPADRDHDGVIDELDQCIDVPAGGHPDPVRAGCPLPDADGDTIPDANDACPDKPGAPDPDPKKNGCPGLVQIKNGQIVILTPVFFATSKDIILPKSFPVLTAVANALKLDRSIKRVSVEGHTDSAGKLAANMDLSDRRAKSVVRWLITAGGIEAVRLEGHGYGPTRPIASNKTSAGKAANRRVEFHIVDPAPIGGAAPAPAAAPAPEAAPPKGGKHGKAGKPGKPAKRGKHR